MNVFICSGRLTRDAEVKTTQSGTAIMNFTVANDVGYGEKKTTNWVNCSLFGNRAQSGLLEYMKKGQEVTVSGELKLNEYTNKEGVNRASLNVNIDRVKLHGSKSDKPKDDQGDVNGNTAPPADFDDSSLPF